jgi:hypothetical protein
LGLFDRLDPLFEMLELISFSGLGHAQIQWLNLVAVLRGAGHRVKRRDDAVNTDLSK